MSKQSKRYAVALKLIEAGKVYSPDEALTLVKAMPQPKFDAAVEVHLRLGIDVKQANQQVRGSVVLPHGTGKQKRIAVFCGDDKQKDARATGAEVVGGEDLIKQIQASGKCDFDIAIATPDMMKLLAPIAKILGQKGLMPNPKTETIAANVAEAVTKLRQGKVSFKADDTGNLHQSIGRVSFEAEKLKANLAAFVEAVKRAKPAAAKGTYIQKAVIVSSMGPGVAFTA